MQRLVRLGSTPATVSLVVQSDEGPVQRRGRRQKEGGEGDEREKRKSVFKRTRRPLPASRPQGPTRPSLREERGRGKPVSAAPATGCRATWSPQPGHRVPQTPGGKGRAAWSSGFEFKQRR